ncbi:MAG TPA: iron ABC transporter permease [Candidatus Polarisedimenticolia bacterium]|nr:iron ABC transporter permease [Candidatus Polarisedimenticolia bacterium]
MASEPALADTLPAPPPRRFTPARAAAILALLAALLAATVAAALTLGSTSAGLRELLFPDSAQAVSRAILLEVRLPRILLAAAVGACLSAAGVCFQAVLRNPLADPYILGVSGGAGLGSILASAAAPAAGLAVTTVRPAAAFGGALAAVAALLAMSRGRGRVLPETMILLGVVMNATIMAAIMFIVTMADFSRYAGTMYWLIGNLASPSGGELALVYGCLIPGLIALTIMGQPLNVLAGGEELAGQLGLDAPRIRVAALGAGSLVTAAAVSLSGLVGFVGLVVPHAGRVLLGPDNRLLLPASALLGGAVLVAADTAARALFAPTQIPVGVITALMGGPCFLWLFARRAAGRTS